MATITSLLERHPLIGFYALVFAISWGGILLIIGGPGAIPGSGEQIEKLTLPVLLALFAGPSTAGIIMSRVICGQAGFHELLSRLVRWRVRARWYAAAVLFAPVLVTTVLLALALVSPAFMPAIVAADDKAALVLFGIGWGLVGGGLLEELGWTGFAVPSMTGAAGAEAYRGAWPRTLERVPTSAIAAETRRAHS